MRKKYQLDMRPIADPAAVVAGEKYRFTVLTDRLIRMEYQEEGRFVDEPTQRVLCREFPKVKFRVLEKEDSLEIVTDKLHLYYDKKPFSREGLTITMHEGFHHHGSAWAYGDAIEDLRGTARTLDEANGAIELEPGLMSRFGFTVMDDSDGAFLDPDQWPRAKDRTSVDLYFFGYGHDYRDCLKDFYRLSGPTPLLPRFTLGNWWSRYYKYTEESYLALMDEFRDRGIPFSTAVIDMDWHLVDIPKKYGTGWTGYTWNRDFFPDPKRFMDQLHQRDMKITLNVHPADGVRAFEADYLPMAKELGIDWENEDAIPFDAGNRPFLEAYFKYLHHPNEEQGVDFWWLDWQQGGRGSAKGIDTLWLLNHLHFIDSGRDGKTPLTFSRYAGIGSHRYPIGFSGDTVVTWESLDFQPYFTANASNVGYTWWSHDIGGHMLGYRDDELTTRWVQLGVFSPIMRLHSSDNEFLGKEPWNYNLIAEKTMTEFLQLRHKLLPYLHTMNYRTHEKGEPLVQPMYYTHDVPEAYEVPNQFWFGSQMIVCPITQPVDKQSLRAKFRAWLPEGDYIDFFSGVHYRGGRKLALHRGVETLPVLVKAGGILPLAADYMTSHVRNPEELEVRVYQGADGFFEMVEDNDGKMATTNFSYTTIGQRALFTSRVWANDAAVIPEERICHLVFCGVAEPKSVTVNGREVQWWYDSQRKELLVTVFSAEFIVELLLADGKIHSPDRNAMIYDLLQHAQVPFLTKTAVYKAVCKAEDPARILGSLREMEMSEALRDAVAELILADL